jgi:hypothetical protein
MITDLKTHGVIGALANAQTVTTTTTGLTSVDMLQADGRLTGLVRVSVFTAAAGGTMTVQVQQSTATNGTYTNISGASVAVGGVTAVALPSFDRDNRYLSCYAILTNATTVALDTVVAWEQRKLVT